MFKRLRLWCWKWFRPSKYVYHIAEGLAEAYQAGLEAAEKEANHGK